MLKQIPISTTTWEMLRKERMEAIEKYSKESGIEKALLKAIIKKESSFWPLAIRIEPHLKNAKWYKETLRGIKDLHDYHYCSYGLMQIMYGLARSYGFTDPAYELFIPDNNIKYGVIHLTWLFGRYRNRLLPVISAYNQGSNRFEDLNKNGIKDDNEKFINQPYVDDVYKYYQEYGGKL